MKIKMLKTRMTSPDGFKVVTLKQGETYPLADMAAIGLVNDGAAVAVDDELAEIIEQKLLARAS